MGRKSRICEICGVRERQRPGFFANFPIDEQRCIHWVQIVGKEDLVYIPIEKLHEVRFICGDHFVPKDFNKKGNRLKKRAYPKLHLSALPLSDTLMRDFPLHVASKTGAVPTSMESKPSRVPTRSRRPLATLTTHNIMATPTASTSTEILPTPWNHKRLETMDGENCKHIDHDHCYARVQHYDHTYARHPDTDDNFDTAATTRMESETVAAAPAASTSTEEVPPLRRNKRPATTRMESETVAAAPAASTSTEEVPPLRRNKRPATTRMESETVAAAPAASTSTEEVPPPRKYKRPATTRMESETVAAAPAASTSTEEVPPLRRNKRPAPGVHNPLDRHVTMRDVKWTCFTHFTKISVNKIDGRRLEVGNLAATETMQPPEWKTENSFRSCGRPRRRWRDDLDCFLKDWPDKALNRTELRKLRKALAQHYRSL